MNRTALTLSLLLAAACSDSGPPPAPTSEEPKDSGSPAADSTSWVAVYDPQKAWNGYTLDFYRRRMPILIDMNGRIVHSWPEARVKSRVKLLPDGSLLGLALGKAIFKYAWNGELLWERRFEDRLPHHDLIELTNGNTMVLVQRDGVHTDDLLELDPDGEIVWEWRSEEHLADYLHRAKSPQDMTHANSVREIPENPWYEAGDERFRPGNLLVSARNLDTVFLLDRQTGEVLWSYNRDLDLQHEAVMIGPGFAGHGNVMIFNNGYRRFHTDRTTSILEIDPTNDSVVWEYRADGFYTATTGVEQPLANGNVLVSSSRGGRIFEITRDGEIVWQWTPPFDPQRPHRYAYDYCPQLAALDRPEEQAVRPEAGYRWVDRGAYRFARRGLRKTARINGRKHSVLKTSIACSRLFLPAAGKLELGYGLDEAAVRRAGRNRFAARFDVRLSVESSGEETTPFTDTVDLEDGDLWREAVVDLDPWAFQKVELCLEARGAARSNPADGLAYWGFPHVSTAAAVEPLPEDDDDLTEEEIEARKKHLKALGYVD